MKFRRFLLIVPLLAVASFLVTPGVHFESLVSAQDTKTNTTGYATGTKCPKTGTYKATNGKVEIILVVEAGKIFPTHSDGTKTIWYPLKSTDEKVS